MYNSNSKAVGPKPAQQQQKRDMAEVIPAPAPAVNVWDLRLQNMKRREQQQKSGTANFIPVSATGNNVWALRLKKMKQREVQAAPASSALGAEEFLNLPVQENRDRVLTKQPPQVSPTPQEHKPEQFQPPNNGFRPNSENRAEVSSWRQNERSGYQARPGTSRQNRAEPPRPRDRSAVQYHDHHTTPRQQTPTGVNERRGDTDKAKAFRQDRVDQNKRLGGHPFKSGSGFEQQKHKVKRDESQEPGAVNGKPKFVRAPQESDRQENVQRPAVPHIVNKEEFSSLPVKPAKVQKNSQQTPTEDISESPSANCSTEVNKAAQSFDQNEGRGSNNRETIQVSADSSSHMALFIVRASRSGPRNEQLWSNLPKDALVIMVSPQKPDHDKSTSTEVSEKASQSSSVQTVETPTEQRAPPTSPTEEERGAVSSSNEASPQTPAVTVKTEDTSGHVSENQRHRNNRYRQSQMMDISENSQVRPQANFRAVTSQDANPTQHERRVYNKTFRAHRAAEFPNKRTSEMRTNVHTNGNPRQDTPPDLRNMENNERVVQRPHNFRSRGSETQASGGPVPRPGARVLDGGRGRTRRQNDQRPAAPNIFDLNEFPGLPVQTGET